MTDVGPPSWRTSDAKAIDSMILIQGAGIAGLVLARELQQQGRDWLIVESAPLLGAVGAGITLASNALKCLRHTMDIETLRSRGQTLRLMRVHNAAGRRLSTLDTNLPDDPFHGLAIHRKELQAALLDGLDMGRILLDRSIAQIEEDNDATVAAVLTDGTRISAQYLVGADGIRSGIRKKLAPASSPRFSGEAAWRAVVPHRLTPADESVEVWGRGKRLGYIQISEEQVYLYATLKMSEADYRAGISRISRDQLFERLGDLHGEARTIVEKFRAADDLIHNYLEELRSPVWSKNRIVLIGDAAHAITPNLGQGAAMAIEDANVLGRIWAHDQSPKSLETFENVRRERVAFMRAESWKIGKFAQWNWPPAVAFRDWLIAHAPRSQQHRLHQKIFSGVADRTFAGP